MVLVTGELPSKVLANIYMHISTHTHTLKIDFLKMSSDRQFAQQLSVTRLSYMPLPSSEIMFPFKLANLLPA